MEEGSVDLTATRVNMLGAPGAGKTCSLRLLLNEPPPNNDTSTPIACPAVRAMRVAVCKKIIWNRVTRANLLDQLAADLDAASQQEKLKEPLLPVVLSLPDNTQPATEIPPDPSSTSQSPRKKKRRTEVHVAPEYCSEVVVQEILATQLKGIRKSDHWLYIIDSGGQPAYQELLPLFTRAASLNIITLDLSKPFNEKFDLMYRIDGQYFPCHSKSSQLAFFQSAVSTGASFKPLDISCISKKPTHSMHLVLGTHYDKVSDATLQEKEEILKSSMSSLQSYLQNCVIHHKKSIIFPVNTIAESEERTKYSEKICKAIWCRGSDASLKIKIPIRWFAFELSLPDKQSIISVKEALSIGERYGMKEEDTKQALRYFHDVSLMLYYPEVTNVVFIDSKPILENLSQLLALTYVDDDDALASISEKPFPLKVMNNLKEGFFNEDIFEHLNSKSVLFSLPEFQLPDLIRLLLHLNIITKLEDEQKGHYFIPYALPSYNEPVSVKEIDAKPLLIVWREEKSEEILPVPTGLFPLTIVHLLNQKEYVTKISPSTPEYHKF
uniref:C-terminal of Roc (COR) domain-containing protein n=1 Tax=Amphimedon queenslandica TaxID=400682 RepID=A0A1X7TF84_AMPQE